mmetsp:Transcript_63756/g.140390  ORF Transcript_63756/g.140390 Transcript_63756/m.140390 type:complete len:467 (-) Transcript_63756:81-1481(-)
MSARPQGFVKCKALTQRSASSARAKSTKAKPLPRPLASSRGISTEETAPCLPKRSRNSLSPVPLSKFFTKTRAPSLLAPSAARSAASPTSSPAGGGVRTTAAGSGRLIRSETRGAKRSPPSPLSSSPSSAPTLGKEARRPGPRRPSRLGSPGKALASSLSPTCKPATGAGGLCTPSPRSCVASPRSSRAVGGGGARKGEAVRSVLVQEPPPAFVVVRIPRSLSRVKAASSASRSPASEKFARCSSTPAMTCAAFSFVSFNIRKEVEGEIRCFARKASNTKSRSEAGARSRFEAAAAAAAAFAASGSGGGGASGGGGIPLRRSPKEGPAETGCCITPPKRDWKPGGCWEPGGGPATTAGGATPEPAKPAAKPCAATVASRRCKAARRISCRRLELEALELLLPLELPLAPLLLLRRCRLAPRGRLPVRPPMSAQLRARRNHGFPPHSPCWAATKNCLSDSFECLFGS